LANVTRRAYYNNIIYRADKLDNFRIFIACIDENALYIRLYKPPTEVKQHSAILAPGKRHIRNFTRPGNKRLKSAD
jgi:hypothetical protein